MGYCLDCYYKYYYRSIFIFVSLFTFNYINLYNSKSLNIKLISSDTLFGHSKPQ